MSFKSLCVLVGVMSSAAIVATGCSSSSKSEGGTDSGPIVYSDGGPDGSATDTGPISDTGGGGTTDTGGGTGGNCQIPNGTYTITNTIAAGGTPSASCPPPDSMFTYPPPATDAAVPDVGAVETGPNPCTSTTNGCTVTTTCTIPETAAGFTVNSTETETISSSGVSGSSMTSYVALDGGPGPVANCSYTFTWTLAD